ncbi:Vps62-related protein [Xanthobacter sp. DSM 24535]|uniref:Vps62-related protein n=1 Tax=Roseixanthobacter psychrophilus TaxID=3119917 RepID=UPI003728C3D9
MSDGELEPIGAEKKDDIKKAKPKGGSGGGSGPSRLSVIANKKNDAGVGHGYDVSRGLNIRQALRGLLFDLQVEATGDDDFEFVIVKRSADGTVTARAQLEWMALPTQGYSRIFGSTADQYASEVTDKLGLDASYGGFSGAISTAVTDSRTLKTTSSLLTLRFMRTIARVSLPTNYKTFVRPEVAAILDGTDEELADFFEQFGTHFVRESLYGGYCDCTTVLKSAESSRIEKVEASIKASFDSSAGLTSGGEDAPKAPTGSVTARAERNKELSETFKKNTESVSWLSVGGKSAVLNQEQIPDWAATIDEAPTLCGFETKGALMPIWTLCSKPERARKVEALARQFLKQRNAGIIYAIESKLKLAKCDTFTTLLSDKGMGTANDMTVYVPVRSAQQKDFFLLGHVVENHYGQARGRTYLVKDPSPTRTLLMPPVDCIQVWSSAGSGFREFSIWRMVPPDGYVALGHIVSPSWKRPPLDDFRCVREVDTEAAKYGGSVWSNTIGKTEFLTTGFNPLVSGWRMLSAGEVSGAVRVGDREVEIYPVEPKTPLSGLALSLFHAFDYWNDPKGFPVTLKAELLEG